MPPSTNHRGVFRRAARSLLRVPSSSFFHRHRRPLLRRSHRRSPIRDARSTTPIHGDSSTRDAQSPWLPPRNALSRVSHRTHNTVQDVIAGHPTTLLLLLFYFGFE
ncbi:hypothetical protein HN51_009358 [Arachis hypogaea]